MQRILLCLFLFAPGLLYAAPAATRPVLIAYYLLEKEQLNRYSSAPPEFPVTAITPATARMLTHINFAFLDIGANGGCVLEAGSDVRQAKRVFAELRALKRYNRSLRLMFSLGGWAFSNDQSAGVARYRAAAASAQQRRVLARSCVAFMQRHGFDGIDIDWEYPRSEDAAGYVQLLQTMREELRRAGRGRARPYQLSIAAAADLPSLARTYSQLRAIAAQVDYLNLMAYDLNGPWQKLTNHQAHLYADPAEPKIANPLPGAAPAELAVSVDRAVQAYLEAGVPARQLVLGLPFYGRAYFGVAGGAPGLYQPFQTPADEIYRGDPGLLVGCDSCAARGEPRIASYAEIQKLLNGGFGYRRHFGATTRAASLYHSGHAIFVSYDDAESFAHKVGYLKRQGLAGAMFWRLGQDDGSLLPQLHRDLSASAPDYAN